MNLDIIIENEKKTYKKFKSHARRAILVCITTCVFALILQLIISMLVPSSENEIISAISTIIIYSLFMIIPFGLLSVLFKTFSKNNQVQLIKRELPKKPFLFITGTLGLGYMTNVIFGLFFSEFAEKHMLEGSDVPVSWVGIILMYVSNAILPAFIEEWAFRKVIFVNLLPYGKKGAILISSLLFGIMHINPQTILFTTIIGIMLALCYEYTGSLKVPILIHFLNNAIATTMTVFVNENNQDSPLALLPLVIIFSLSVCAVIAIIYYTKYGFAHKKVSLIKPTVVGYKLSLASYISCAVFNVGMIPLVIIYYFYYFLLYLI